MSTFFTCLFLLKLTFNVNMQEFICKSSDLVREFRELITNQSGYASDLGEDNAESLRRKANELYSSKHMLKQALHLYTESLRASPVGSEDMVLALGNRSAVTFQLKQYKLCLRDIENVLSLNLASPSLLKKLLIRKIRCLHHLHDLNAVHQACIEIKEMCMQEKITPLTKSELDCLVEPQQAPPGVGISQADAKNMQPLYLGSHTSLPSACKVLTMKLSPSKGRFLQASADVPSGSLLLCEEPYVNVLLPDYWATHCYHCLQEVHSTPVFCRRHNCKVRYCTTSCQTQSFNSYHEYECKHLNTIVNTGIGHLAYRVIAYTGYKALIEYRDRVSQKGALTEVCQKGYDAVYHLVTNAEHILPDDLYQFSKTALLLVLCAMESQFFPASVPGLDDSDVMYIASLLLRHIQQLICNAHAITMVSCDQGDLNQTVMSQTQDKLASAIYPTASLMNHSCSPNIITSFVGSTLIVKNSVDLNNGDEVYSCYGPHYQKMERSERKESLSAQYYFTCDCVSCVQQQGRTSTLKYLCCTQCQGRSLLVTESTARCQDCHSEYDANNQVQKLLEAKQLLGAVEHAPPNKGLELVRKAKDMFADGVVHKYSIELANLHDQEAKCHAALGNMVLCAQSLSSSITILEHIYPEYSIERAHEYHKLSEVLCNTHQFSQAMNYASKARAIFCKQYSQSHSLVQEVDELCAQIKMCL